MTFTEVQMELSQGKTVDSTEFQKMIDGNFGSGNATGTIGGGNYIITITRNGTNYKMGNSGKIETLDELPIDFEPGVLEKSGNTYTINSIEDLVAFSYNVNSGTESYEGKTVTLGRNLDFQDDNSYVDANSKYKKDENGYIPDSTSEETIKSLMINKNKDGFIQIGYGSNSFNGSFNGQGKSVSNLYIKSDSNEGAGFFGYTKESIQISNLSILMCDIKSNGITGGIVGNGYNNKIINCHVNGNISNSGNNSFGGIVGGSGVVLNCYNSANIIGNGTTGGIAGIGGTVINCYNCGDITSNYSYAGGITGSSANVTNCYNNGNIIANSYAGGITSSGGTISNCYNYKDVTSSYAGGITSSGTVNNCFNSGTITVTGNNPVGGIVSYGGNITNCHNIGNIIGLSSQLCGEIIGAGSDVETSNNYLIKTDENNNSLNANPKGAIGKSQAEMDEIMSVENFVNLMNSYVEENNADSTKTPLKRWKVENGMPVFAE